MRNLYKSFFIISVLCGTLWSPVMKAQVYPAGFAQQGVGGGLAVQTASAFAPDGRIFVAEQTGRIRIIKNGATVATPFATLAVDATGERGLLGIAVDPDFLINKFIYVYHTVPAAGTTKPYNRVLKLNATNDVVSGAQVVLLNLEPLDANIHNAGAMHFGPDKKLYIAVGENAKTYTAQDLTNYGGKLLRINTDGSPAAGNPFISNTNEKAKRVWALGLRNPFTFAIDKETGKIFVNDVGQALWEEINDATVGGRNFGWPSTEGKFTQASFPNFTNPVYAYAHPPNGGTTYSDGIGCAIVGGAFISPSNTNYPAQYRGKYFYQDNCGNWINMLDLSTGTAVRAPFATAVTQNSLCLTMGIDGLLYFSARHHVTLYKIVYNNTSVPTITNQPVNVSVAVGEPASFSVTALGTPPLSYQWQKNNVNIPGATSATYSIPQTALTHAGSYRVIVSNNTGSTATSNAATLTVINNLLPTAEILTPTAGTTYVAGTTINFSGKGTDPEDGALPAQSMSWQINFHHDVHHHDEPPRNGIASGSFTVPQTGETSPNVWYRIILTVTDALGSKGKDSVDVYPLKSTLQFNTNPAGLQITLEGQPLNTPASVVSVEGTLRTLGVISPQMLNNQWYAFESWSHGGAQTQDIVTPSNDATYTANFKVTENSFYRAINLNGPALSIDGNNWEASTGAPNFSITGATAASQNITPIPATDANRATMMRSFFWYQPNLTISAVPQGTYQVWVYVFEDNFPVTYSILLEGNVVQANYNSGSAGTWRKLGPFSATINDGNINVRSTSNDANFSGIEIWRAGQTVIPPTVTNPLVDQNATADTPFTYTFLANTFTPSQPANALSYSASLDNGTSLPSWLTFNPATRTFSGTPNNTNVGTLNIRVTATETTGGTVNDVFSLNVISGPTVATFYRAINLNGPALSIDGNNWEASTGAPNFSITGATAASQNITPIPATDANRATMMRSFFWYQPNLTISAVPQGTYQVWVYVFEDNFPVTYSILLEGNVVQTNYNSGSAGTWRKLGPFSATINDGNINVRSTSNDANFSGVEIWRAGLPVTPPTVTNPLVDQSATGGTPFTYTFLANTFTPSQPGNTLSYSASLDNGTSLPSWLTFNPATRTFSGTPNNTNVGTLNIRVTATETTGGTVNDVFSLNVISGPTVATFYRAINLNGPALSIDGNNWEASTGAPNFSITGATAASQNITPIPATDANRATMMRSFFWYQPNLTISAVPQGTYQVWVYVFEDNFPVTYSILLEGNVVQTNYNSGSAGTWRKLGPFSATINDGNINVRSTSNDANFSGVEIWTAGQGSGSSSLRLAAAETVSESEESEGSSDLSFYPNPFSNKGTIWYRTTQPAPSQLSVYDVRGVLVWSRQDENVSVGHIQEFELEDDNLQNGVYILEFVNGIHTKRLKIIRSQ